MASYAAVETALARMHGADAEAQKGAFRGRIKHLQRLGLPLGEKPGKGRRINYTNQQVWQFALALELSEFGLDPSVIAGMILFCWDIIFRPRLEKQSASDEPDHSVLIISLSLMSASWTSVGELMGGVGPIGWVSRSDRTEEIFSQDKRRSIAIDTWRMLKELHLHLDADI